MNENRPAGWIDHNLASTLLLLNGTVFLVLNLVTSHIIDKVILFGYLIILNLLRRRKINYLFQSLFILCLVLLNIYPPNGRVLFRLFTVPITTGSLLDGLTRGLSLSIFILAARYGISSGLPFPGLPGKLLSRTLFFLDRMQERRKRLQAKGFLKKIDKMLLDLWQQSRIIPVSGQEKSSGKGILFVIINILIIIILLYFL